ncbi:MAG: GMC family oxidoreductase N-terminal domain-containing protein [Acidobacteriota bacterium]
MGPLSNRILRYDIVIVGSGAGGGTVARALSDMCADGVKIGLLDWGGRFERKDNTRRELEMARKYYFADGGFQTSSQDMTLAFCKAVGGSTNVYTGVTFRPPRHVLEKWNVPCVTWADLEPRCDKYIAENNVHLLPPERINRNNRLFKQGCQALGWPVGQFPISVKDCAGLNTCNLGCARHAKQGTAQVQIPAAEARGVEVISSCRVDRIEGGALVADILSAQHGLAPAPYPTGRYRIEAPRIVLAAGTMNTPPILMRSFGKQAWPALGRYFTCHPALTLVAEHDTPVNGARGHPKSYYCDAFAKTDRFLLETCFYFPFTTAKNLAGFGVDVDALMSRIDHQQQILVLILDKARKANRVTIDRNGATVVHYDLDSDLQAAMVKSIRASGRLFFAAAAKRAHLPATANFFTTADQARQLDHLVSPNRLKLGQVAVSAAHLMGGCRMGTDAVSSVTDPWGRVHHKPGLYVADASLFPDSVEVNPYLTIMALADRVAEAVRKDFQSAAGTPV